MIINSTASRRAHCRAGLAADRRARHPLDARRLHLAHRLRERAVAVDGAAAILAQHGGQSLAPRVARRVADAEIGGEADQADALEAALAQTSGEPRRAAADPVRAR